jgi:hypothetical protein
METALFREVPFFVRNRWGRRFSRGDGVRRPPRGSPDRFAVLPDAAKFVWSWRAFNEPAVDGISSLANARIVIYEDLCREPEACARDLFAFSGLDWNKQTAAFINRSTTTSRATIKRRFERLSRPRRLPVTGPIWRLSSCTRSSPHWSVITLGERPKRVNHGTIPGELR